MTPLSFKKILVTGGCGFIGSNFIRYFYHAYPEAHIINYDLLSYAGNPENLWDIEQAEAGKSDRRYQFIRGDVCDEHVLDVMFASHQFDLVIHFAAESHVDRSIFNVLHFVRTNVEGTRALIEAARKYRAPRFIHISTDEVYGSIDVGFAPEEAPLRPSNPYSASKASADLLVQSYMKTHGFPAILVRGSNNYGPYQYPEKLIPMSITNLIEDRNIPIHGTGAHARSWLHVEDFCRAIDLIAHQAHLHQTYNVSGEERTNLEVLSLLAGHLNKNFERYRTHVNDRPGADMRYAPDSNKLQREFGWRRQHSFDESVKEVVAWYLNNPEWWRSIRLKKGFIEHYERQAKGEWC